MRNPHHLTLSIFYLSQTFQISKLAPITLLPGGGQAAGGPKTEIALFVQIPQIGGFFSIKLDKNDIPSSGMTRVPVNQKMCVGKGGWENA